VQQTKPKFMSALGHTFWAWCK